MLAPSSVRSTGIRQLALPVGGQALALLGRSSHEVLHVGDSFSSDGMGARAVGIPVLWINRKRRIAPVANLMAEDLRALPSIPSGE